MTPKEEVKTLEEKYKNRANSFFLFFLWILEFVCSSAWPSAGPPFPWHDLQMMSRHGMDFF